MNTLRIIWISGWIILAVSAGAQSRRLMWDKPANGEPVDFYSVYQLGPSNAAPIKLGDTTNLFWPLPALSTNIPIKWRVTAHQGPLEGSAAEFAYQPSIPLAQPILKPAIPLTNLVVNGGFEAKRDGWQLADDCAISASPGAVIPPEGKRCLVFGVDQSERKGSASQTIQTISGSRYTLSFDAGIISFVKKKNPQSLSVTVQGATTLTNKVITLTPTERAKTAFIPQSILFRADAETTTISFNDVSTITDDIHLLLDDVRVLPQE